MSSEVVVSIVTAVHLLAQVLCRAPSVPLARHRDVVTSQGTVRGYLSPHPPHFAFLGIPYARPPTRHARFKAPAPPLPWDGIFEAIHKIKCPQPDSTGDENCLVVNVFAPEHSASLPVLVYFHGGGFQKGWGFYNVPVRLLSQDIILVSFNYRLGALGFLSLSTPGIPGNAGLKDQVAALYWVQINIAKFGGNPSEITVYGTGSGAASIEYLILSNMARNLFQRAILENGSALSPSSKSLNTQEFALTFAQHLGYNGDNNIKSVQEFYYNIPPQLITDVSRIFLPCVEQFSKHSLIDQDPWDIIQKGNFYHISMMIVYTMAEETAIFMQDTSMYKAPENFSTLLPNNLEIDTTDNANMITKFIEDFYFGENKITTNAIKSYIDYVNDVFLQFPMIKSAVYHALRSSKHIFLMNFSYEGSITRTLYSDVRGARCGDILKYLSNNNVDDNQVSEKFTTLWSNFIKLGDPTPLTSSVITEVWQPVIPRIVVDKPILRGIQCLKFTFTQAMFNTELNSPQLLFWDRVYEKFYKH